jgi:hypothetical protein
MPNNARFSLQCSYSASFETLDTTATGLSVGDYYVVQDEAGGGGEREGRYMKGWRTDSQITSLIS